MTPPTTDAAHLTLDDLEALARRISAGEHTVEDVALVLKGLIALLRTQLAARPAAAQDGDGGPIVIACETCKRENEMVSARSRYNGSRYWVRACSRCVDNERAARPAAARCHEALAGVGQCDRPEGHAGEHFHVDIVGHGLTTWMGGVGAQPEKLRVYRIENAGRAVPSADVAREAAVVPCKACSALGHVTADCPSVRHTASGGEATAEGDGVRVAVNENHRGHYGESVYDVFVFNFRVAERMSEKAAADMASGFRDGIRSERRRAWNDAIERARQTVHTWLDEHGEPDREVELRVRALAAGDEAEP